MQNSSIQEIELERSNLYENLQAIPTTQDELEEELFIIETEIKRLTIESASRGEDVDKALQPLIKRKAEIIEQMTGLNAQRSAVGERLEAVDDELERRKLSHARKAKHAAKPALTKELGEAKIEAVKMLAKVAALVDLVEGIPIGMLDLPRVSRSLNGELYRTLKQQERADISELYNFGG